jgi:hypothetical protein
MGKAPMITPFTLSLGLRNDISSPACICASNPLRLRFHSVTDTCIEGSCCSQRANLDCNPSNYVCAIHRLLHHPQYNPRGGFDSGRGISVIRRTRLGAYPWISNIRVWQNDRIQSATARAGVNAVPRVWRYLQPAPNTGNSVSPLYLSLQSPRPRILVSVLGGIQETQLLMTC